MGDACSSFLERSVDHGLVRVTFGLWVKSISYKIMNSDLHLFHICTTRKIEVFIQQITMAVLFSRPGPRPANPTLITGNIAFFINTFYQVKKCLIGRKR